MGFFKKSKKSSDKDVEANISTSKEDEKALDADTNVDETESLSENNSEDNEMSQDEIAKLVDDLINYFTIEKQIELNQLERGKISKEEFLRMVRDYVSTNQTSNEDAMEQIIKEFSAFIWSYDVLDPLIADNDISDIKSLIFLPFMK